MIDEEFAAAFEKKVAKFGFTVTETGCHEWDGYRHGMGPKRTHFYGFVRLLGDLWSVHRASYTVNFGPIPEGMFVCHKCDNPPCFNPEHLFIGTAADNNKDRAAKGRGRQAYLPGETNPMAKLTEVQVLDIRRRAEAGENYGHIAAEYGISRALITKIKQRKAWRHLGGGRPRD